MIVNKLLQERMNALNQFIKWCSRLVVIASIFFFSQPALAASDSTLTKAQQQEVKLAKQRTQQALNHWNNRIDPVKAQQVQRHALQPMTTTVQSIGTTGDILVTLDGTSSGSLAWAGGHAGVVSDVAGYVVESFGNKGDLNGVRHWTNNWGTRYKKVKGLRVQGALSTDYSYAASYARTQIGKPYNYNFFYISTTNSFYCSQLVWRSFYNRGFDLNDGGAVWPVDLIESPLSVEFYSQG